MNRTIFGIIGLLLLVSLSSCGQPTLVVDDVSPPANFGQAMAAVGPVANEGAINLLVFEHPYEAVKLIGQAISYFALFLVSATIVYHEYKRWCRRKNSSIQTRQLQIEAAAFGAHLVLVCIALLQLSAFLAGNT